MTLAGWFFMISSWTVITALTVTSFYQILKKDKS